MHVHFWLFTQERNLVPQEHREEPLEDRLVRLLAVLDGAHEVDLGGQELLGRLVGVDVLEGALLDDDLDVAVPLECRHDELWVEV